MSYFTYLSRLGVACAVVSFLLLPASVHAGPSSGVSTSKSSSSVSSSVKDWGPKGTSTLPGQPVSGKAKTAQSVALSSDDMSGFSRGAFRRSGDAKTTIGNWQQGSQSENHQDGKHKDSSRPDFETADEVFVENERVIVSGSMPTHPESRFSVQRTPLPGGRHTRSSEEANGAPEMKVTYKLNSSTSARVELNPQDETSPLYSPLVKENALSATGVYLDVGVQDNVQLRLGGEVRSHEKESLGAADGERETGASVGLRWDF